MAAITLGGSYGPYAGTDFAGTSRAGKGFQSFSVTTGAVVKISSATPVAGSAAAMPSDFRHAVITVTGAGGVRVRTDGTDPTATIGRPIADGTVEDWQNSPTVVRNMWFIGVSGTCIVDIEYFL